MPFRELERVMVFWFACFPALQSFANLSASLSFSVSSSASRRHELFLVGSTPESCCCYYDRELLASESTWMEGRPGRFGTGWFVSIILFAFAYDQPNFLRIRLALTGNTKCNERHEETSREPRWPSCKTPQMLMAT